MHDAAYLEKESGTLPVEVYSKLRVSGPGSPAKRRKHQKRTPVGSVCRSDRSPQRQSLSLGSVEPGPPSRLELVCLEVQVCHQLVISPGSLLAPCHRVGRTPEVWF